MSVYSLLYTRLSGTVSNIVESMFAWMTQLELVSLRAVTRTEYRCATVIDNTSIGDSSTSVYKNKRHREQEKLAIISKAPFSSK